MMFLSGVADGLNQTVMFHYYAFENRFPNANEGYWNPTTASWKNKWKNGDPTQGEAFFGSSSFLVWTTDGFHLSGTIDNAMMFGGIGLGTWGSLKEGREWWWYLIDAAIYGSVRSFGFWLTYDVFFEYKSLLQ